MTDVSTALDLSPIINPILEMGGLVIAGIVSSYVPKVLAAFEARTGIHLTDQQRAIVMGSVRTAAGEVETLIDQGALHVAQVHVSDPTVLAKARAAIDAAPAAAAALGMTEAGVARMIVGAVDTGIHNAAAAGAKIPPAQPAPPSWMQGAELKPLAPATGLSDAPPMPAQPAPPAATPSAPAPA